MEEEKLLRDLKSIISLFLLGITLNAVKAQAKGYLGTVHKSITQESKIYEDIKAIEEKGRADIAKIFDKEKGSNSNKKTEKYVFISFSIPENALLNIIKQAKENDIIPVLRGFKDGSYRKTVKQLEEIIKQTEYGVSVDPEVFKEFNIKAVPTYVVAEPKKACLANMSCKPRIYNKITGNISAKYALEELNKKGEEL